MPQEPIPVFIDVPISKYARSRSQPRYGISIDSIVNKKSRSKTNPIKAGSAYVAKDSSSPKKHQRKISEPFHVHNNIHQGKSFQPGSQSVR